jgi:hypothetical protein
MAFSRPKRFARQLKSLCSNGDPARAKILLAVCLAGEIFPNAFAEVPNYLSRAWQAEDGLPENKVMAMVQTRDGTALPHIKLAQSTMQMDWSHLELVVFAKDAKTAKGLVCLPDSDKLVELSLSRSGSTFKLSNDPLTGKVTWKIRPSSGR